MPKVSVIIPTHNRPEFLRLAIISVLNQTFQDFEILVVDDASTDDTHSVVASFTDRRLKYICQEVNKGPAASRNTGLNFSTSDYIAFLDDDDEWLPDKLCKQINLLENSPSKVGGVYTGYTVIDRNSGKILAREIRTKTGNIFDELIIGNVIGATSSLLLRKECFDRVGLFDENMLFSEDWDMWIRISKVFHFECIKELLVKWYVHDKDKLTLNLEALANGIEIMVTKYGKSPEVKKNYSRYYLGLGVDYCCKGNTQKGREAFLRAIRLNPFEIKHYFNLGISLLGTDNFKKLKEMKERVRGAVKSQ